MFVFLILFKSVLLMSSRTISVPRVKSVYLEHDRKDVIGQVTGLKVENGNVVMYFTLDPSHKVYRWVTQATNEKG